MLEVSLNIIGYVIAIIGAITGYAFRKQLFSYLERISDTLLKHNSHMEKISTEQIAITDPKPEHASVAAEPLPATENNSKMLVSSLDILSHEIYVNKEGNFEFSGLIEVKLNSYKHPSGTVFPKAKISAIKIGDMEKDGDKYSEEVVFEGVTNSVNRVAFGFALKPSQFLRPPSLGDHSTYRARIVFRLEGHSIEYPFPEGDIYDLLRSEVRIIEAHAIKNIFRKSKGVSIEYETTSTHEVVGEYMMAVFSICDIEIGRVNTVSGVRRETFIYTDEFKNTCPSATTKNKYIYAKIYQSGECESESKKYIWVEKL